MGNAAYRSLQRDEAFYYFERCLHLDSNYAPAIMGKAQMLADKKQYEQAIKAFTRVLAINVAFHSAYKSRGIAEFRNGNFAAAVDDFTSYLLFDDKDGGSYYFRGLSELALKNKSEACTDLHYAVQVKYEPAKKILDKSCEGLY
jgi:tetratricopeptide (TPR) repeat protein